MKSVSLRKPKREDLELNSVEVDSERERKERTLVCCKLYICYWQINVEDKLLVVHQSFSGSSLDIRSA